ncbi:MAG: hypothetical protein Q8937_18605 [Bacteroidota bacterium]|nr:hypothetical protein [Bacteroidota bacterium]
MQEIRNLCLMTACLVAVCMVATPILPIAQSQTRTAPCSQEELMTIKGKWVKVEDHTITGQEGTFSASQKREMILRMDKAFHLVQAAWPDPKGMEVKWEHSFGYVVPGRSGTLGYNLSAGVFHFYCNPDLQHLGVDDESDGGFGVHFNTYAGLLYFDTSMHVGRYYVALMPARVGKVKDADLYQTSLVRANEQFIVIARDGQFPLTMLSRKQYLICLKGKLQREEARGIANELKYAKNDQQKSQVVPYWQSHYDPKLKLINDYLANASEDDLAQTAYIKNLQEFTRFYTEKEGGCAAVINNAGYFRPQQTPCLPQFIVVVWGWNDGEGPSGGLLKPHPPDLNVCCRVDKFFKESMEQNLDPDAFRQMLDQ